MKTQLFGDSFAYPLLLTAQETARSKLLGKNLQQKIQDFLRLDSSTKIDADELYSPPEIPHSTINPLVKQN